MQSVLYFLFAMKPEYIIVRWIFNVNPEKCSQMNMSCHSIYKYPIINVMYGFVCVSTCTYTAFRSCPT